MRRGISVSPGVSIGTAYCIHEIYVDPDAKRLDERDVTAELARYEVARDKTAADLHALTAKVRSQVGEPEAAVFALHESILRDKAFTKKIRSWIVDDQITAQTALHRLLDEYTVLFSRTKDEYLKERLNDVRDVVVRLSAYLSNVLQPTSHSLDGQVIVVADELLPSHVVALGDKDVHGIVTQSGSQTSHAAIVARSRGIPAVSGVHGILRQLKTGDTIVVDGRAGHVIVNPDSEQLAAFKKLEREFFHLKDQLAENRDRPAVTRNGISIELLANVNGVSDCKAAQAMGATGVGLYRTEYLYLTHASVPDEEEQLDKYRKIITTSPERTVTIRTLDIGGDKTVPYLGHQFKEANPFLGWRSIRLSFEHPEFFMTQIRAILRAAGEAGESCKVKLMFPMITTLEELRRLRNMLRRAYKQLESERKTFAEVQMGMMLEVPAAAVCIDTMLDQVDFVSIGSNDLVQYLMAADRDNPKVSQLCQPLAPPVLRVLSNVITACRTANKPVTLCGEMAGDPQSFVLLLGMGLRSFSMSPAFIPSIKQLATHVTMADSQMIFQHARKLKTTAQVQRYVLGEVQKLAPELEPMFQHD